MLAQSLIFLIMFIDNSILFRGVAESFTDMFSIFVYLFIVSLNIPHIIEYQNIVKNDFKLKG